LDHRVLQPGQPVAFRGPFGDFHLSATPLPRWSASPAVPAWRRCGPFSATCGSAAPAPAKFFFGARTRQDLFLSTNGRLRKSAPWFEFIPVLSHEPADSPWTGERGLVTRRRRAALPT
jgi:NAD(P)H-flavin reductase